jgi:hypothetical protein
LANKARLITQEGQPIFSSGKESDYPRKASQSCHLEKKAQISLNKTSCCVGSKMIQFQNLTTSKM